jgi:uncharacterized membrane protein
LTYAICIRFKEESGMAGANTHTNVGDGERIASALIGGALLSRGLRRRSFGGLLVAVAGGRLLYRGFSGHCGVYEHFGKDTRSVSPAAVNRAITIGKPADELYRLWKDPHTLSRIMGRFAEVTPSGEKRQHWSVHGPLHRTLEWDAEIIEDQPGTRLRWTSAAGARLPNEGEVQFRPAPQERGTEVSFALRFMPPGGVLGKAGLKLLGATPALIANHALRRFKSLAETGEIASLRHNPSGRANVPAAAGEG